MKKVMFLLVVLCAVCGSAFADITISDWGIQNSNFYAHEPIVYDGLMEDNAPAGFTVHANPEMWGGESSPQAVFQSYNITPGWMVFYNTTSFTISVTGFDDLIIKDGNPIHSKDFMYINISSTDDALIYKVPWNGDGVYKVGREQAYAYNYFNPIEADSILIGFNTRSNTVGETGYYLGDNTKGTIGITFPESGTAEVPEPSSLLALAFGGAGTAFAFRKRK